MKDTKTEYSIITISSDAAYQISQLLLNNKFRSLSSNAKILYILFVHRHNVSLKDGLVDAEGNVFFIMLREEMGELLSLSKPTIIKTVKELIDNNLVKEVKRVFDKTSILYLLTLNIGLPQEFQNDVSGKRSLPQDGKNSNSGKESLPQDGKNSNSGKESLPQDGKNSNSGKRSLPQDGKNSNSGKISLPQDGKNSNSGKESLPQDGKNSNSGKISLPQDDIKKTPDKIPDVNVSEIVNISDTIKTIINNNFSITFSETQIEKLASACNNDLELFISKVELLKQQSEVNNIFGWLKSAIEKDYQPNIYTYSNKNKKPKNRIVNYKGHNWDYEKLEAMEQLYLETSIDSERKERIKALKSKISKELQKAFDKTFNDVQIDIFFRRCDGNFDMFEKQLKQLKTKVKQNPESSIIKLYLSLPIEEQTIN